MRRLSNSSLERIETLLNEFTSVPAISGFEKESGLPKAIANSLKEYNPTIDTLGNVIVKLGSGGKKVLIEAHLDEVGFIKTSRGFVAVGSIPDEQINGSNIMVGRDGRLSYFRRRSEKEGTLMKSPAFDNRTGCTALALLPGILKGSRDEIYLAFTVREETTKEGILQVVRNVSPNVVISIDSAYALPYKSNRWQVPECGKGPAIQIQGRNFFINEYDLVERVAKKAGLPYQFEIVDSAGGGTNISALVGQNIRRFQVNIPVRYQHTNLSETDIRDIEGAALLVSALVRRICSEDD